MTAQAHIPITLVGATVIDGNGGAPVQHTTIVIDYGRITAIGPRSEVSPPPGSNQIDVTGKYVLPGLIDTNAHLTVYGVDPLAGYETLVRYAPHNTDLAIEGAQLHLKYGVTTIRDSYGVLTAEIPARAAIESGTVVGARILAAGNIVGWGGPFSVTFGAPNSPGRPKTVPQPFSQLTRFQQEFNDLITQGTGEELMDLDPPEIRVAVESYVGKGPDFIKFGGTAHWMYPTLIGFSAAAQRAIVEVAHTHGLVAETHATSREALRMALDAGIDLIQHPEVLSPREMPDDIVERIRDRDVICSVIANTLAGAAWKRHLEDAAAAEKRRTGEAQRGHHALDTAFSRRFRHLDSDIDTKIRRENAQRLIVEGCRITIGTDNYHGAAPEFRREPKLETQEPGIGTILALEGLVELGMSPGEAIVAATRNGAIACRALDRFGTLEVGKCADLIVLERDPLESITNIRTLSLVISRGRIVDRDGLPNRRVFSRPN
jgi:imidazolonepropionase-like amidohydrolase